MDRERYRRSAASGSCVFGSDCTRLDVPDDLLIAFRVVPRRVGRVIGRRAMVFGPSGARDRAIDVMEETRDP